MDEILPDVLPIIDNIIDQPIFIPPPILIDEDSDLGVVSEPLSFRGYVSESDPTDVFAFSLDSTQNLNLALTKISTGDDADINLYRDVDGNGLLDSSIDSFITRSIRSSNLDEAINLQGQSGNYLAEVVRYAPGSVGSVRYNFSLSATPNGPTTSPSNLLPTEVNVGDLSNNAQTFYDWVGNMDTADVYRFSLSFATYGYNFSLDLTGLSNDADVRLIQDLNNNGIVDGGEELTRSQLGSNASESIHQVLYQGNYFVQVYQYSGDTSYQLDMGANSIIG